MKNHLFSGVSRARGFSLTAARVLLAGAVFTVYGTRTPAVVLRVVPSGKWFVIFMRVTLSFELPSLILRRRAAATA